MGDPPRAALYGLAGVSGLVGGLAIGMVNYGFGVFVNGIAESNPKWTRTEISAALSVMSVCAGLISPTMGYCIDRFGVRLIVTGCMLLQCLGFFLLSGMKTLEILYVSYLLVGLGHAGTSYLGVGKVVGELFPGKNKGRVMGFVTSFNNICGLAFVQIHTFITQNYGWQVAAEVFAVIFLVLSVMYFSVMSFWYEKTVRALKESTERIQVPQGINEQESQHIGSENEVNDSELALGDAGASKEEIKHEPQAPKEPKVVEGPIKHTSNHVLTAVVTPIFFFTAIGAMCAEYTYNGVLSQIVPALVADGFDDETAAHVLSLVAGLGIVAKLCCGILSERLTARRALELCMIAESIALVVFAVTTPDPVAAWIAFALFGSGFGGVGALRPLLVLETFGNGYFGRIYGILLLLFLIPALTAPIVAGISYDQTGSYAMAFLVAVGIFLAGAVLLEIGGFYLRREKNETLPPYASCLRSYRVVS